VGALTLVTINNMVDLTRAAIIKLNAILLISILSLLHAVPDETSIQRLNLSIIRKENQLLHIKSIQH
jgi:hypothetical protein